MGQEHGGSLDPDVPGGEGLRAGLVFQEHRECQQGHSQGCGTWLRAGLPARVPLQVPLLLRQQVRGELRLGGPGQAVPGGARGQDGPRSGTDIPVRLPRHFRAQGELDRPISAAQGAQGADHIRGHAQ